MEMIDGLNYLPDKYIVYELRARGRSTVNSTMRSRKNRLLEILKRELEAGVLSEMIFHMPLAEDLKECAEFLAEVELEMTIDLEANAVAAEFQLLYLRERVERLPTSPSEKLYALRLSLITKMEELERHFGNVTVTVGQDDVVNAPAVKDFNNIYTRLNDTISNQGSRHSSIGRSLLDQQCRSVTFEREDPYVPPDGTMIPTCIPQKIPGAAQTSLGHSANMPDLKVTGDTYSVSNVPSALQPSGFELVCTVDMGLERVKRRLQRIDEKIIPYLTHMENEFSSVVNPPDTRERIRIIRKNLLPHFVSLTACKQFDSVEELSEACKRVEAAQNSIRTQDTTLGNHLVPISPFDLHTNGSLHSIGAVKNSSQSQPLKSVKNGKADSNVQPMNRVPNQTTLQQTVADTQLVSNQRQGVSNLRPEVYVDWRQSVVPFQRIHSNPDKPSNRHSQGFRNLTGHSANPLETLHVSDETEVEKRVKNNPNMSSLLSGSVSTTGSVIAATELSEN